MRRPVILHWGISSFFGWGIYGLNLALNWAADGEIEARTSFPIGRDQLIVDPLRRLALRPFELQSRQLAEQLNDHAGKSVHVDAPVLVALGNDFSMSRGPSDTLLQGKPHLALVHDMADLKYMDQHLRRYGTEEAWLKAGSSAPKAPGRLRTA